MTNEHDELKTTKTYFIRIAGYQKFSTTVEVEAESAYEAAKIYDCQRDQYLGTIRENDWENEGWSECWGAEQIEDDPYEPYEETAEDYSLAKELTPPRLVYPGPAVVDIFD